MFFNNLKHSRGPSPRVVVVRRPSRGEIVFSVFLIGSILRIGFFWMDSSFWGDEAAVALNLKERSFSELGKPLDYGQHAPLLYLLVEKGLNELAGSSEHVLRSPSLVASLLSILLYFCWLRRTTRGDVLPVAFLLFALNPRLILYSAQLKPYAIDVVGCLVVCLCAFQVHRYNYQSSWLALFALVGCVLVWLSFPVVFVLAGVGLTLIVNRWFHGYRRHCSRVILLALLWLISFLFNQYLITHHSLASEPLRNFWEGSNAFPPLAPTSLREVRKLFRIFLRPFADPLWGSGGVLIGLPAVFWLVGLLKLMRSDPITAGICLLPVVLTFLASGFKLYPFEGRLLLFLVPLFLLPVAWGIVSLASGFQDRMSLGIVLAFILTGYMFLGGSIIEHEFNRAGARRVVEQLSKRYQSDDVIYVLRTGGYRTVFWYLSKSGLGDADVSVGSRLATGGTTAERDLDNLVAVRRLWFVAAEADTPGDVNWDKLGMEACVRKLDERGTRLYEFHDGISHTFLYDLKGGSEK